jgi:cation diffusion facilitator family transporter
MSDHYNEHEHDEYGNHQRPGAQSTRHDHAADGPHAHDEAGGHDHADHDHSEAQDQDGGHARDDGNEHAHGDHDHEHPTGIKGVFLSIFKPHSHDAADSIDSTLEASAEGMRALKISLLLLGVTASFQLVIVILSRSVGLLADTVHNFGDALTAVPLAAAFWLSRRPPNKRYTYGYGRSEDLAGIFIVLTILASSAVAAYEAINRLFHPQTLHHLPWVVAASVIGFLGNEAVAQYRIRVGRKIGSAALEADGYHARTDGFTSLAVVLGAIGVSLGWKLADPIIGLAITVAILVVVKNAARDIYRRLMDAVDPALVDQVTEVLASTKGIERVSNVRIRWIGHELNAEVNILSAGTLSLTDAHDIAEHAEHELLHEVKRLTRVTIHTSPLLPDGSDLPGHAV